eukprot:gene4266-4686_t
MSRFGGTVRRSSIDDRAKEILERNRQSFQPPSVEEVDYKTLQSEFAELLEGINLPDQKSAGPETFDSTMMKSSMESVSPRAGGLLSSRKYGSMSSLGSFGSPEGADSFDISAADLEVGAFAAKRMKEKAAERRRRMSFDQPTYSSPTPLSQGQSQTAATQAHTQTLGHTQAQGQAHTQGLGLGQGRFSSSPDMMQKHRRASLGVQMSTALSSIHQSQEAQEEEVDRSDDEIYKMLNISAVKARGGDLAPPTQSIQLPQRESLDALSLPRMHWPSQREDSRRTDSERQQREEQEEDYDDDFEADGSTLRSHILSSPTRVSPPVPATTPVPPQSQLKGNSGGGGGGKEEESYADYADDFEENSPAHAQPKLSAVEQIMQRWSAMSSDTTAFTVPAPSLPKAVAVKEASTKQIAGEEIDIHSDKYENDHQQREANQKEQQQQEEEEEEEDIGVTPAVPNVSTKTKTDISPSGGALLSAIGDASLITSIPPPPPPPPPLPVSLVTAPVDVTSPPQPNAVSTAATATAQSALSLPVSTLSLPVWDLHDFEERKNDPLQGDDDNDDDDEEYRERTKLTEHKENGNSDRKATVKLEEEEEEVRKKANSGAPSEGRVLEDAGRGSQRYSLASNRASRYSVIEKEKEGDEEEEEEGENLANLRQVLRHQSPPSLTRRALESDKQGQGQGSPSKAKFAASTAAKLRQRQQQQQLPQSHQPHQPHHQLQQQQLLPLHSQQPRAKMTRRVSDHPSDALQTSQEATLRRLSRESADLAKKFSSLQSSVRSLNKSQPPPPAPPAPAHKQNIFVKALLNAVEDVKREASGRRSYQLEEGGGGGGEAALRQVVQDLMKDVYLLHEKEKDVIAREKAVAIKEGVAAARRSSQQSIAPSRWRELQSELSEALKKNDELSEEIEALRLREQDILRKLDEAKSRLFEVLQEESVADRLTERDNQGLGSLAALSNLHKRLAEHVLTGKEPRLVSNKGTEEEKGGDEMVSVEKADLESLLKDYSIQERLLESYHRENERLALRMKEHEAQEQSRHALFLDQQEELNKQLNALKNQKPGGYLSSQKTAEQLRQELELDSKVRHLQQQVEEERIAARERERLLQNTVTSLREERAHLNKKVEDLQSVDLQELQQGLEHLAGEKKRLEEKMRWFVDNQRLVADQDQEVARLRSQLYCLKQEVIKRGGSHKLIVQLLERGARGGGGGEGDGEASDTTHLSAAESSSATKPNANLRPAQRSYHDIRRIQELEGTVRDLREALAKRFPDSVATLIHATKVSDLQQETQVRALEEQVRFLQEELAEAQGQFDRRLRTLRQEYEKMRLQYEAATSPEKRKPSPLTTPATGSRATTQLEEEEEEEKGTKDQRIKALETELQRMRVFYTRKIEDLQRRYEQQIRALKRGDDSFIPPPPPPEQDHAEALKVYAERVERLQQELMATARELGQLKAKQQEQERRDRLPPPPPAPSDTPAPAPQPQPPQEEALSAKQLIGVAPPLSKADVDALIQERVREALLDFQASLLAKLPPASTTASTLPSAPAPVPAPSTPPQSLLDVEYVTQLWQAEQDRYICELREERARNDALRRELAQQNEELAKLRAVPDQPKSPKLLHFQLLEQQLHDVENNLRRREHELALAVEECRAAAKLDRQRLLAAHEQELREKDDQLEAFQRELQALLNELQCSQLQS